MIRVYAGFDPREAAGWNVFVRSLIQTSKDYSLIPMTGEESDGTNLFTYERFLTPERCGWSGWAISVDGSDMMLRAPIQELYGLQDRRYAVMVVKHDYLTKSPRKYVGTSLEADNHDYPRKNWSSVILWNCAHWAHFRAREKLRSQDGKYLHRFGWLEDHEIGSLPAKWNVLVGEQPTSEADKLRHYTLGIPAFKAYEGTDGGEWEGMRYLAERAG